MTLALAQKEQIVRDLTELAKQSISAVAADYRGMTVSDMTELRSIARDKGVKMRVYRNTLARRALAGTDFECLREALVGPVILFFAQDEPGAAARILQDFSKKSEKIAVKALALDGIMLPPEQLKSVASLPTLDEARASLAAVLLAPVTQFVRTLNEPAAQVVRVIKQVGDSK